MKILIIGEYSGFSKYLSRGLKQLGHEPFVFSWGDSFKAIEQDQNSYYVNVRDYRIGKYVIKNSNRLRNRFTGLKLHWFISRMEKDWDCAFIINFGFIKLSNNPLIPFVTIEQIQSLLKDKTQIYLSACGGDYIFYNYIIENGGFGDAEKEKARKCNTSFEGIKFETLISKIKCVIPITISYKKAYDDKINKYKYILNPVVPLPFDVNSVNCSCYKSGRIVIMHGVNRPEAKGSNFIIPAMERIKKDFPELVDIDIIYRVPLSEYLLRMEKSTIVIDQCYGSSAGMNAIEALSMGKVVLGRDGEGNAESLKISFYPVVNIEANEDDIYCKLKELVKNPSRISELSFKSREFACQVYDCKKVAAEYIHLFKGNL